MQYFRQLRPAPCFRTGAWPRHDSGPIVDAPGESWSAVDMALRAGNRGLPGGESLAHLLRVYRGFRHNRRRYSLRPAGVVVRPGGVPEKICWQIERLRAGRNIQDLPPFTIEQILTWADEHFAEHGDWPIPGDGLIAGTPGETWRAVETALSHGLRVGRRTPCTSWQMADTEVRGR